MTAERTGPYLWKGNDGTGTHVRRRAGLWHRRSARDVWRRLLRRLAAAEQDHRPLRADSEVGLWPGRRPGDGWSATGSICSCRSTTWGPTSWPARCRPGSARWPTRTFDESCKFAAKLSQTAEQNGPGVQRLADKLTKVEPAVRDEFARDRRRRAAAGGPARCGETRRAVGQVVSQASRQVTRSRDRQLDQ